MPTYSVSFYSTDPFTVFSRTVGNFSTWTGPTATDGTATITDNEAGTGGQYLDDDNAGGETATADVTVGGSTSTTSNVDAERIWTVRDTVTGQVFEIAEFDVENGTAAGDYTLSEVPLVAGRVYETIAYDSNPNADVSDPAFSYADYTDYVVSGTAGDDTIDGTYAGDPHGDVIDGNDVSPPVAVDLEFNWSDLGADETDLTGGATVDTGGIQVDVTYTDDGGGYELSVETSDTQYVDTGAGETFSTSSAALLAGDNSSTGEVNSLTTTIDFSAVPGGGFANEVENVSFRINDVDGGTWQDVVTILAYDANGNSVPVSFTISGNDTILDSTIIGNVATNDNFDQAAGSVLIEIAGPVASIDIDYDQGLTGNQWVSVTDIHFTAVPSGGSNADFVEAGAGNDYVDAGLDNDTVYGGTGNDTLIGGAGADTLYGEDGDDTLQIGSGDTAIGGDGDDTFIIDASALDGTDLFVQGGETGESVVGDTLDFNGQMAGGTLNITNSDDGDGGLSGTAELLDGTLVTFENIENIICFCADTGILTPNGQRPVQELCAGDEVITRDRGVQKIRWVGKRTVMASPKLAPVAFMKNSIGNHQDLLVSPQHRLLVSGYQAQLFCGEDEVLVAAKHLINGSTIRQRSAGLVTYYHLLFDQHEIIQANGCDTESYHPGAYSLPGLDQAAREELFQVFPELRLNPLSYGPCARTSVRGHQAQLLAA